MNVIPIVSMLILFFSLSWIACFEQYRVVHTASVSQYNCCSAHYAAAKHYQRWIYNHLSGRSTKIFRSGKGSTAQSSLRPASHPPQINGACARLNVWPLLQALPAEEVQLRQATCRLLRQLYHVEDPELFLAEWLVQLHRLQKQDCSAIPIEKVSFPTSERRRQYYAMLMGIQVPPLQEVMKAEQIQSKICPFHAAEFLLQAILGESQAKKMIEAAHHHPPQRADAGIWQELFSARKCKERSCEVVVEGSDPAHSIRVRKRFRSLNLSH